MARILVAEPSDVMRKLVKALVESHPGWLVCGEAVDGHEAITKAAELLPDLIILDLAMPSLNGLLTAREIAKNSPGTPILLHTLHDFPELVAESKKYGVRDVIGKGESGDRMLATIDHILSGRFDELESQPGEEGSSTEQQSAATLEAIDSDPNLRKAN
jgi:DNA-binding NarL/FixJ family response regulator